MALVIWLFEFFEEFDAGGIGIVPNVEEGRVGEGRQGCCFGGKSSLVPTFVLLSTHFNHNKQDKY